MVGMILIVVYIIYLIYTVIRILLDTTSTPKTLGYLLLVILLPGLGPIVYYAFGRNYRHRETGNRSVRTQREVDAFYQKALENPTDDLLKSHTDEIRHFMPMVHFLQGIGGACLWPGQFKLLINGEAKFPEVLRELQAATRQIHMEYYDWENDTRGNQIKDVLLDKALAGIEVKVLYDDFASSKIKRNIVRELHQGGVQIFPKIRLKFSHFANRINHRDHRKIIIVDGKIGFVGGINLSDRYDNSIDTGLYWRDTHVKISGALVNGLQRHFVVSWNTSASTPMALTNELFPACTREPLPEKAAYPDGGVFATGQVVAGGPTYPKSNIMLSYMRVFTLARERLYITNPYFIPSESISNALCQAAISGVDVRILIPEKSDSAIVGAASRFYFRELLEAGVRIYLYGKGFVHAKTVVADSRLSVVGTANMDIRSFDLNFEIMSVIYGKSFGEEMEQMFLDDLKASRESTLEECLETSGLKRLIYSVARLISSFL